MQQTLSLSRIFSFWVPLAATWLMMSVEGPLLAALIARMAEPKFNLAAYGVSLSFALIIEAPVIMMMSASTALVQDGLSYRRLRNFTFLLNLAITAAMIILLLPPVFQLVASDLIGLPANVAELTHISLLILLPWPGVIGYRRFFQGILIRADRTQRVAYGTVIRLLAMLFVAFPLYWFSLVPGAWVGAAALSAGVILEAVASRIMVHSELAGILDRTSNGESEKLTYGAIWAFYYPLALTSTLSLGVHPLITFFMGRSRLSVESLAVLPVVNSLVFIFRSVGLAYQEVAIALSGLHLEGYRPLRNFMLILASTATIALSAIAFSPLQEIWFVQISGLDTQLASIAATALLILAVIPALSVLLSFQRAMLVNLRITRYVTWGTVLEVSVIALLLYLGINRWNLIGASAAALAMVCGRLAANLYLSAPIYHHLKQRGIGL